MDRAVHARNIEAALRAQRLLGASHITGSPLDHRDPLAGEGSGRGPRVHHESLSRLERLALVLGVVPPTINWIAFVLLFGVAIWGLARGSGLTAAISTIAVVILLISAAWRTRSRSRRPGARSTVFTEDVRLRLLEEFRRKAS